MPGHTVRAGARGIAVVAAVAAVLFAASCARETARLSPEWQRRLDAEGVVRRADNLVVRHTRERGRYESGYKDRLASVIVTKETVLIHQNERALLEITPRTRRAVEVRRLEGRIRIRIVGERVTEVFSFEPREDAPGWAEDVREVARSARAVTPEPRG